MTNMPNNNTSTNTDFAESVQLAILFVMPVLSIATMIANGLVCFVVWRDPYKQLRSPFTPYVVNLCVTDFLVGLVTQPLHMAYKVTSNHVVKEIDEISFFVMGSASTLSLCLLCLDRYNAMVYPLTYRTRDRRVRCVILITIVWTIAVVYPIVVHACYDNDVAYEKLRYYFLHVIVMVTFLVLLLTCSSIVVCKDRPQTPVVRYHSDDSSTEQGEEERFARCKRMASRMSDSSVFFDVLRRRFSSSAHARHQELAQLSKTFNKRPMKVGPVFLVMLCEFVTCFLPPILLVNYLDQCDDCRDRTQLIVSEIIHISVALFSLLNPFIYCWRLSSYRTALRVVAGAEEAPRRTSYHSDCNSVRVYNNTGNGSLCGGETPPKQHSIVIVEESELPFSLDDEALDTARMKRRAFLLAGKCPALRESISDPDFAIHYVREQRSVSSARSVSFNL